MDARQNPANPYTFSLPILTFIPYAILRETSSATSYQVVRLVFRPYTKLNERFARQYQLCPPLQFPVDSTLPSIDHNLSGLKQNLKL